ncbi:MAG: solute:sodium symporter family transporter [Victivallaceae bacterium]|nr:solute:sodium symporter family transporter [Victivallaceae bacterium]
MWLLTIGSFLFFTVLVGVLTWWLTRNDNGDTNTGFFLAGRSLTFPLIAGSLLLTNLSTEQLVGLNGDAYSFGLNVMCWEVTAVFALSAMALFFLPRFLKSGITTVSQLLAQRFDKTTQIICDLIFLLAYATVLLPIILYTGAQGLTEILDVNALFGISSDTAILWGSVWMIGIIGAVYALFGGLRSVAISDTLNSIGLLIGGLLIVYLALVLIGDGQGAWHGFLTMRQAIPERFNSIPGPTAPTSFGSMFTGALLIHVFYWCTNQQIIQRTLASKSLAEGQKGVLLAAGLKLIGPCFLVLPGIIAYYWFTVKQGITIEPVDAYGRLVRLVLPPWLAGFFAAVMVGAIFSSFDSVLNSASTIFGIGIYSTIIRPNCPEKETVVAGKWFGWIMAIAAMFIAPLLVGHDNIFTYLQQMNGLYSIPILSVGFVALLTRRVPAVAAKIGLVGGFVILLVANFIFPKIMNICGGNWHFLGILFVALIVLMLAIGAIAPTDKARELETSNAIELVPWRYAWIVALALLTLSVSVYWKFADISVLLSH